MSARAMSGSNWSGQETDIRNALHEYGAIHFHDDDLDDARWQVDFEWRLPAQLTSGVYAARLRAGDSEDHIPFFVRPPRGEASASIAFLAPTNSYLAYANEQLTDLPPELFPNQKRGAPSPDDQYAIENGLLSPYDTIILIAVGCVTPRGCDRFSTCGHAITCVPSTVRINSRLTHTSSIG